MTKYSYKLLSVFFSFILFVSSTASADDSDSLVFRFKYRENDSYRILSQIHEDVFVNKKLDHHAEILNRISVQVTGINTDGSGNLHAAFATSENATAAETNKHFTLGNNYESNFTRSPDGAYKISDDYFMPVVRDVPLFPESALSPGDTWSADGYEAHDLRRSFNLKEPFKIPFTAHYTYDGPAQQPSKTGKKLYKFTVQYSLYYNSPKVATSDIGEIPQTTMGFSKQTIYWDAEKGAIDHYNEQFRIVIETERGTEFKFEGTASAEVTEFKRTATEAQVKSVQDKVAEMGLKDVSVRAGKKGLTISIENIQFEPDSSELRETEKDKIRKLASILNEYKDNDLLISGYTAMAGTEKARHELSEERAEAVADYVEELGIRDKYHLFTQGFGGKNPIAENDTETGRSKNRRVEITIMDN
ncbi:MAG: OmpA family protein [Treponema sp.]|jgi:outer membrane protein OmpA-like peptidoglycan-associated protein|nr:OmpA family protein [Treponema sp.]